MPALNIPHKAAFRITLPQMDISQDTIKNAWRKQKHIMQNIPYLYSVFLRYLNKESSTYNTLFNIQDVPNLTYSCISMVCYFSCIWILFVCSRKIVGKKSNGTKIYLFYYGCDATQKDKNRNRTVEYIVVKCCKCNCTKCSLYMFYGYMIDQKILQLTACVKWVGDIFIAWDSVGIQHT